MLFIYMSFESTLLKPDSSRYVMFPLKDKDTWTLYKKQIDSFWRVEEVDTSSDKKSFDLLNTNEQRFIKMILAFFAASDGIVSLHARDNTEVQHLRLALEHVHNESKIFTDLTQVRDEYWVEVCEVSEVFVQDIERV